MELTAQLNPALRGASTSCHTAAALQAGDLDTSFWNLSPRRPNTGDGLQSPVKLIPGLGELGLLFQMLISISVINKTKTIPSF